MRTIEGQATRLSRTMHGIAYDATHDEIVVPVALAAAVLSFHGGAAGAESPIRVIQGPATQMVRPHTVTVDEQNGEIIVGDSSSRAILVFDRMANGNAKPLHIIRGPNTQIDRINQMAIYPAGKLVVVAMPGVQGEMEPPRVFVGMWSLDDNGNVPPKWTINGDQSTLRKPFAVALNPDQKEIYVTDMRLNGVMTFSVPEVFEPAARVAAPGNRR